LLHKFDHLSTISGGGYIGSWLAATARRLLANVPDSTFRDVERARVSEKREPGAREERTFLHGLRLYSNDLTPHTSMVSGDTWAMTGPWRRNVFLNQTVLGLFSPGVFVFCYGVSLGLLKSARLHILGGVFCFVAAVAMAEGERSQTDHPEPERPYPLRTLPSMGPLKPKAYPSAKNVGRIGRSAHTHYFSVTSFSTNSE
jgi:hypothetical protein